MIKMNKVVIGIAVAVIVVVIIAAVAVMYKPPTTTPTSTTSTPTTTTPPTYQLSIINTIDGQALAQFDGESGNSFIIVNLTLTYQGSSSLTVEPFDFYLVTNEGVYEACPASLLEGTPDYLPSTTLQKGEHISGCVAFEIPSSATPEKIEYKNLAGNVIVCAAVPSPSKYIVAIGDVYACLNNKSMPVLVSITHPTLPANIFAYGGQIQNYTIQITDEYYCSPIKITAIKVSPSTFTVVNCGGAIGKELTAGQTYCFTVSLKYPNDGGYFKSVYITVCVECT